jgi:hypothetical protein
LEQCHELPLTCKLLFASWCRFVDDIVARSKQEITEESVMAKMVSLPNVYRYKKPGWMEHGKFDSILNGAKAAILKLKQTNNWEDAKLKCALDQVQAITIEEVNSSSLKPSSTRPILFLWCRLDKVGRKSDYQVVKLYVSGDVGNIFRCGTPVNSS